MRPTVATLALTLALLPALSQAKPTFVPGETQYIAALGAPTATSGTDAETWGFWSVDPGPRGVWSTDYADLLATGGQAPAGWQFDPASWWLEEHGLLMESPSFPLPPGQYVVTAGAKPPQP
jgi:hypothetical protein